MSTSPNPNDTILVPETPEAPEKYMEDAEKAFLVTPETSAMSDDFLEVSPEESKPLTVAVSPPRTPIKSVLRKTSASAFFSRKEVSWSPILRCRAYSDWRNLESTIPNTGRNSIRGSNSENPGPGSSLCRSTLLRNMQGSRCSSNLLKRTSSLPTLTTRTPSERQKGTSESFSVCKAPERQNLRASKPTRETSTMLPDQSTPLLPLNVAVSPPGTSVKPRSHAAYSDWRNWESTIRVLPATNSDCNAAGGFNGANSGPGFPKFCSTLLRNREGPQSFSPANEPKRTSSLPTLTTRTPSERQKEMSELFSVCEAPERQSLQAFKPNRTKSSRTTATQTLESSWATTPSSPPRTGYARFTEQQKRSLERVYGIPFYKIYGDFVIRGKGLPEMIPLELQADSNTNLFLFQD